MNGCLYMKINFQRSKKERTNKFYVMPTLHEKSKPRYAIASRSTTNGDKMRKKGFVDS